MTTNIAMRNSALNSHRKDYTEVIHVGSNYVPAMQAGGTWHVRRSNDSRLESWYHDADEYLEALRRNTTRVSIEDYRNDLARRLYEFPEGSLAWGTRSSQQNPTNINQSVGLFLNLLTGTLTETDAIHVLSDYGRTDIAKRLLDLYRWADEDPEEFRIEKQSLISLASTSRCQRTSPLPTDQCRSVWTHSGGVGTRVRYTRYEVRRRRQHVLRISPTHGRIRFLAWGREVANRRGSREGESLY